jgi:hypothetical protein
MKHLSQNRQHFVMPINTCFILVLYKHRVIIMIPLLQAHEGHLNILEKTAFFKRHGMMLG